MSSYKLGWLYGAAMIVMAGGPAHANFILNGGFETGDFTDWTVAANNTSVQPAGGLGGYNPHSGAFYAALGHVGLPLGTISQGFSDAAGGTLDITLWPNSNGTTPNEFEIQLDGNTLFSRTNIANSGGYFEIAVTAPATGSDTLTLLERNDPSYLALDDVSVTEQTAAIPEPSSMALVGASLAGLAFIRRRTKA